MKKIIALIMSAIVVLSVLAIGVSATTKSDLLTEAAKSPVYKYVQVSLENAARSVEITDDQAAAILPYVKDIVSLLPEDKGNGADNYGIDTVKKVSADITSICDIMGWKLVFTKGTGAAHAGDVIANIYDANNKLIFSYDGDAVADTSAAGSNTLVYAIAAVLCLGLGVTAVVVAKRKVND